MDGDIEEDMDEPPTAAGWHDLPKKLSQVTVSNISRGSFASLGLPGSERCPRRVYHKSGGSWVTCPGEIF